MMDDLAYKISMEISGTRLILNQDGSVHLRTGAAEIGQGSDTVFTQMASMQVHGDMSVGIGYGLSEQMLLDEKTGRVLNGSLLDYKLPTMMDSPDLCLDFVELEDPTARSETRLWAGLPQFLLPRPSAMLFFTQPGFPSMRSLFHLRGYLRH